MRASPPVPRPAQAMVFGNMNDCSGSGVAFTRNPSTGEVHE
jgi:pyruvate,orthophosphate dikinase